MSALQTYAGWTKPYPAAGMEWGWFTADTAIEGLKAAGANPTQPSFISNLRKVTSFDHHGLTCPVNYAVFSDTNQQFPGNCTWMVKVQGKQFVSLTSIPGKRCVVCLPPAPGAFLLVDDVSLPASVLTSTS
jgi:hypothetical protein